MVYKNEKHWKQSENPNNKLWNKKCTEALRRGHNIAQKYKSRDGWRMNQEEKQKVLELCGTSSEHYLCKL